MSDATGGGGGGNARRLAAYAVHALTASGAVLALLALEATLAGRLDFAFLWLGIALIVDGLDGSLARRADVAANAPVIDGALLDLVVDYATYVFVPVVMLLTGGFLPPGTALAASALVLVTAALYFADRRMKSEDGGFRGFPAVWNLLLFYFAVFRPDPVIALLIVVGCAGLQFAPIAVVHPMRVKALRPVNLAALAAWGLAAVTALFQWGEVGAPVRVVLILAGLWLVLALPVGRLVAGRPT